MARLVIALCVLLPLLMGAGPAGPSPQDFERLVKKVAELSQEVEQLKQGAALAQPVMALEPFIVNLADPSQKRYLKLGITVDCGSVFTADTFKGKIPQIRDQSLLLLSSQKAADLADVTGKIRLRAELQRIMDDALGGAKVKAVYFTEFVVQ